MLKKGDIVKLKATVPEGPVKALRFNDDGEVEALVEWTANGVTEERWFKQDALEAI
jgi:hypothetical protein